MTEMLRAENIAKSFTLHVQAHSSGHAPGPPKENSSDRPGVGATTLPVFQGVNFSLKAGECVALTGASGAGKSTFMRMIYANYVCQEGAIHVRHGDTWVDMVSASPHTVLDVRRRTMGYVSQFLRVIPRVSTLDIVAEPLVVMGHEKAGAQARARRLLERLRIPDALWPLSPLTFSGGEQQRVNIARGFVTGYPILLLDEPTASLDAENRATVLALIEEAKADGAAILGIFHDAAARASVCTDEFDITQYRVTADD